MIEDVAKYFLNLKGSELKQKSGAFVLSDHETQPVKLGVKKLNIAGKCFYCKESVAPGRSTATIASAKMYADIGILTPPPFVVLRPDIVAGRKNIDIITQDINSVKGFTFAPASSVLGWALLDNNQLNGEDKYSILKDGKTRDFFLKFMTPECLDELISIYLADELRTDSDRHLNNYFFYKLPGSDLYQGVALIDIDMMEVLFDDDAYTDRGFRGFINTKYQSFLPTNNRDNLSHDQRMTRIADMLNSGLLSVSNISTLQTAVSYDFPGTIKSIQKEIKALRPNLLGPNKPYEAFARLWEYNRANIGKELGL